jgi:hypothetical protein
VERETGKEQFGKILTNPGHTGFLQNFQVTRSFFSKFKKLCVWQKDFGPHTSKHPKEVDRAKVRKLSKHRIELGIEPGVLDITVHGNQT